MGNMEKLNIPIFRAELEDTDNRNVFNTEKFLRKKICDKYYVTGALNLKGQIEVLDNDNVVHTFNIKKETLSINFPSMLDMEDTLIFASLSDDGKGGDVTTKGTCIYHKKYNHFRIITSFETFQWLEVIRDDIEYDLRVIGIQK